MVISLVSEKTKHQIIKQYGRRKFDKRLKNAIAIIFTYAGNKWGIEFIDHTFIKPLKKEVGSQWRELIIESLKYYYLVNDKEVDTMIIVDNADEKMKEQWDLATRNLTRPKGYGLMQDKTTGKYTVAPYSLNTQEPLLAPCELSIL